MERPHICWTEIRRLYRSESMIKGYIITMVNNHESTLASRQVIGSIKQTKSEIDPLIFPATTPDTVQQDLKKITSIDAQWLKYSYHKSVRSMTWQLD